MPGDPYLQQLSILPEPPSRCPEAEAFTMMRGEIFMMAAPSHGVYFVAGLTLEFEVEGSAVRGALSLFKLGLTFVYGGDPCRRRPSNTRNACSTTVAART